MTSLSNYEMDCFPFHCSLRAAVNVPVTPAATGAALPFITPREERLGGERVSTIWELISATCTPNHCAGSLCEAQTAQDNSLLCKCL